MKLEWDWVKICAHGKNFGRCMVTVWLLIYINLNIRVWWKWMILLYCTKNFCNRAIYFKRPGSCMPHYFFCKWMWVFCLKSVAMNFRRFLSAMDGNFFGDSSWCWEHPTKFHLVIFYRFWWIFSEWYLSVGGFKWVSKVNSQTWTEDYLKDVF